MSLRLSLLRACLLAAVVILPARAAEPLRVFLRGDDPFRTRWSALLAERSLTVAGDAAFPTAAQLDATDVLVLHGTNAAAIQGDDRAALEKFLARGGGLVALHDAIQGPNPAWWNSILGGAWEPGRSESFAGDVPIYFTDYSHPISDGVSNWDFDDRIAWNLGLAPEAKVLASSYAPDKRNTKAGRTLPSIYDIVPQLWTYERKLPSADAAYRAFVSVLGHKTNALDHLPFRAVLLRGLAWAGRREIDSLCDKAELASLRYHAGGPIAPAEAGKLLKLQPDFTLHLIAAEPLINKPISLDWDPAGRLWIAETPEYPFRRSTSGPARDRISILTDTDSDGVMDKKSVFHEGLHLVTSLVLHRDGVIVAQAPDILWLRDTNDDGKSDKTVRLFTGFGTNDTHAVISNFRRGLDGWIYATVGYSRGDVSSGDRKRQFGRITDGVFRFRPDGSALEQVSSKAGNTWGVDVAPDGEIFFSQANGNHINHVILSESALARGRLSGVTSFKTIEDHKRAFPLREAGQQAYAQIDFVGGFTAASGACIQDGGAWPSKYDHAFFVTEPTLNLLHLDVLRPEGPSYVAARDAAHAESEFLASTDLWFRPIHVRVGPDGALYLLDFYNQAAVHNDPRGPRHDPLSNAAIRPDRDRYFGRLWRIQHRDARKLPPARLAGASTADLARALAHPNGWTRATAARLLVEKNDPGTAEALQPLVRSLAFRGLDEAKAQALWILHQLRQLEPAILTQAIATDGKPVIQKNALRIAAEREAVAGKQTANAAGTGGPSDPLLAAVLKRVRDPQPRVRLEALVTLATLPSTEEVRSTLVDLFADLNDPWLESAAIGVAARAPVAFITAATRTAHPAPLTNLVIQLSSQIAAAESPAPERRPPGRRDRETKPETDPGARELVVLLAAAPDAADPLKRVALETLARDLERRAPASPDDPDRGPALPTDLADAFRTLFDASTPIAAAALPLAIQWDNTGVLRQDTLKLTASLLEKLKDDSRLDAARGQLLPSLLAARALDTNILPAAARLLGPDESTALRRQTIAALATLGDAAATRHLLEAAPRLSTDLFDFAVAQLLKRADASLALLDALQSGMIRPATLGPALIHRLRTHGDAAVSRRAAGFFDALRGPEEKEKDVLLARYTPEVEKPGDAKAGKELFTKNCAVCHKFNGEGKDTAPDLTGMGAHGPAELLVHTLDPNRVVELNYVAVNIDTKDDQAYTGIVVRENKSVVVLRDASGEIEVKTGDITTRVSTGRSLMPEGFEALGADGLRDLMAYLCAKEAKYRLLRLGPAFTADSTRGLFDSVEREDQSMPFKKFGIIKAGDVPFEILSPSRTDSNLNVVVLRGGKGFSKTLPRRVELRDVGASATKLHFLGGVGAWAWPWGGAGKNEGLLVARVTVTYADGQQERFDLTNGVVFVDHANVDADVSGSKRVPGLLSRGQLRAFSRALTGRTPIDRITLESFDTSVVPVFVAITAEHAPTAGEKRDGPVADKDKTPAREARREKPPSGP